jgi:hypothetical protein
MPFLKEAVESILSQTYPKFSLLIINDGSTDGSTEYLNSLSEPRIKVIHQENIGLCRSLNKAVFEHTESELIARLDQMETKTRYVFEMSHRRKEGQAEIPFDEWVKLDTPPPVQQFIRYIKGVGRLFFREAGKLIGEGKKWQGTLYLIIAFCAYPSFVQRKLFALRQGNK